MLLVPLDSAFQKISRRIRAVFFIAVNKTQARELVNGGVLIELLLLIGKAANRNILDIYLNTLIRIGHLFIRLGLIGWLCGSLLKQSQPFEDSIKALNAAGITTFAKLCEPIPNSV